MTDLSPATVITLTNGVNIANFSSPHPFDFTDGSHLPACQEDRSRGLMLKPVEEVMQREQWADIMLSFDMTEEVEQALAELQDRPDIDIILIPLPVMTSIKASGLKSRFWKTRTVRSADRVKKICHHDRFCI